MLSRLPLLDQQLLNGFQRDFPLVPRPFDQIALQTGSNTGQVLDRLRSLQADGRIARVGATVRPNTAGASTLAAMSVPLEDLEQVAARIAQEPGVNHSYLREHDWNLWFVLTEPDAAALEQTIARLEAETRRRVLDLRLLRPFNIDLGFSLDPTAPQPLRKVPPQRQPDLSALRESDRPLLHALSQGLPLTDRPFADLAAGLGMTEAGVLNRTAALLEAAILTRIGIIVRHRTIGWSANAMVVWQVPGDRMAEAGQTLAAHPGITLCYQRRTLPGVWDYGLYSMIHARSRTEALDILASAATLPALQGCPHEPLFSVRCYKQTGARLLADAPQVA